MITSSHSTVTPEAFTTFAHFKSSDLRNAASCSGVPAATVMPCAAMRSRTSGTLKTFAASALMRLTISRAVRAGAYRAFQTAASKSAMPDSLTVGTSGKRAERLALVTAIARIFPA